MADRIARPKADPRAAYCLIHLDDLEIEDGSLLRDTGGWEPASYGALAQAVIDDIWRVAGACRRRVVVVDALGDEPWAELGGRNLLRGAEVVDLDRSSVARIAQRFARGEHVILGGFARRDCVARVATALERRGCRVTLHDAAIAPLTPAALRGLTRPIGA